MDRLLSDYIRVYPGIIPLSLCNRLIERFALCEPEILDNENHKFKQVNLVKNRATFEQEIKDLALIFSRTVNDYIKELDIKHFPTRWGYEEFRLKEYSQGDYFNEHVDANDYPTARRFLSIFAYLNVNGGTNFECKDVDVDRPGTIVIFPPLWLYPHYGVVKPEGKKYFLGTYLHYL